MYALGASQPPQESRNELARIEGTENHGMQTKTIKAEVPIRLFVQMESLVDEGWFPDTNGLIVDALRRFLETRRPELMEHYIRKDVEWGLRSEE